MSVDEAAREYAGKIMPNTQSEANRAHADFAAGAAWAFEQCERIVGEHYLHEVGRDILAAIRRSRSTPAAGEGR